MTTASELFNTRRSRLGRASASASVPGPAPFSVDLGFDSSPHRSFQHLCNRRHHHTTNHSHDHHPDHTLLHRRQERDSVSLSLGGRQSSLCNNRSTDILGRIRNPPGSSERLPGSVLLARERLLQRLSSISLSENRQSSQASSGIHSNEHAGNAVRLVTGSNAAAEIQTGSSLGSTHFAALTSQGDEIPVSQEPWKKKPPGLTREALSSLKVEVFSCRGGTDGIVPRLPQDCSICLESFREGDGLICLPCEHRFHSTCLSSWLQCCGDCPYCRKIVVQEHAQGERLVIPEF